jgi:hypothetical protein
MDDFTNTVARVRLEALVGQWRIEAGPPGGPPGPAGDGSPSSGSTACLCWSSGRISQRFTGMFSANGKRIDGRWEIAEDGKTWKTDFDLTYTKVE